MSVIRCDKCDNRVIKGWSFCAYCGRALTMERWEEVQREINERIQAEQRIADLTEANRQLRRRDF